MKFTQKCHNLRGVSLTIIISNSEGLMKIHKKIYLLNKITYHRSVTYETSNDI